MSSTGRSQKSLDERAAYGDHYATPEWVVREFMKSFWEVELKENLMGQHQGLKAFDPCAGGDKENGLMMPYPWVIQELYGVKPITMDIRTNSPAKFHSTNYLMDDRPKKWRPNLIISNPPFEYAMPFVKKALHDVQPGGYVAFLLRVNWLGSKSRKSFLQANMPKHLFVHHRRIKFGGMGKGNKSHGDSIEYGHFVWQAGLYPEYTQTRIL